MNIKTQQISSLGVPNRAFEVPLLRELPGATSAGHHHQHLGIFDCGTLPKIHWNRMGRENLHRKTRKTHVFFFNEKLHLGVSGDHFPIH